MGISSAAIGLLLAVAAQDPTDFADMSLEDLVDTKVVPVNVLGAHTHFQGEWMLGYSFMFMDMHGNQTGTREVVTDDVLDTYMVSPTRMHSEMHMLHLMYGASNRVTLMAMVPLRRASMDHVTRAGVRFTTTSLGLGDASLTGYGSIVGTAGSPHRVLLSGTVTLPTGSVDRRDDTPAGADQRLPYPMQAGAGTFSLGPAVSYLGEQRRFAWLLEAAGQFFPWENGEGYAPGDRFRGGGSAWWEATPWASPLVRVSWEDWGDFRGSDPLLNPMMVPTADPTRRAGRRLDVGLGLQVYAAHGLFREQRVAAELAFPVYQSLNGPQLRTSWVTRIKWTRVF